MSKLVQSPDTSEHLVGSQMSIIEEDEVRSIKSKVNTKKDRNAAQKKLDMLKEAFGLTVLSPESIENLEAKLENPESGLSQLAKEVSTDGFVQFRTLVGKTISTSTKGHVQIFTQQKQLGLHDNADFQQFFMSLCEEEGSLKFARLKR